MMRWLRTPMVAALMVCAWPAQSAQPAGIPSGRALIEDFRSSMRAAGSYHVEGVSRQEGQKGFRETVTFRADVALRGQYVHAHERIFIPRPHRLGGRLSLVEDVVKGSRQATRDSGGWTCGMAPFARGIVKPLAGSGRVRVRRIVNLGAAPRRGILMWHVRTIGSMTLFPNIRQRVVIDDLLDSASTMLVQESVRITYRFFGDPTRLDIVNSYSNYGERVTVSFPRRCASR